MGVVASRSACSSLSRHNTIIALKALLRAKISRGTFLKFNQQHIIKSGRCNAKEEKPAIPSCGHASQWIRLCTTVCLYSAAYLFSPSFLVYYSDFTMLVWIMWIFTLCFDWNSRTWFRKWREGGGSTPRASSLITLLQVGGFICWTGFDSIHPPHAFAQASKRENILWLVLFKLSRIKYFLLGENQKCINLKGETNATPLPF